MLIPRSYADYLTSEFFEVLEMVTDHAPLPERFIEDWHVAFSDFLSAVISDDRDQFESFYWTLEFLVIVGVKKNPHKTQYPEVILEMLKRAFTQSQKDWHTAGALSEVLAQVLVNDNPLSRLVANEMSTNSEWHVHAHHNEMHFRRQLPNWCERLTETQREEWCTKEITLESLTNDLEWAPGPEDSIVPPEFLKKSADDGTQEFVDFASPLPVETAALLLKGFQLSSKHSHVEKKHGPDPFFWAYDILDDYSSGYFDYERVRPVPVEDLVTILTTAVEVFEGDDETAGTFAAGFVEDSLQSREDSWTTYVRLLDEEPRVAELLRGAWIPKSIAERMPRRLRENVITI